LEFTLTPICIVVTELKNCCKIVSTKHFFAPSFVQIGVRVYPYTNSLKIFAPLRNDNQRVIPVKTGIHNVKNWIPASAGMTVSQLYIAHFFMAVGITP
jgi:hypothetical protein